MIFFSLVISFISGLLITVQGVSNSVGSKTIGTPYMLIWLSLVQIIPPMVFLWFKHPAIDFGPSIVQGFKWYFISGSIGIIVVTALSFSIAHTGSLSVFVLVVLGQIIGAAIADQIGLFGTPVAPVKPLRLLSILIIVAGVLLLLKTDLSSKASMMNPPISNREDHKII